VFPEGGRSNNGELQPFIPDFARLIIKLKAPLVPAAVAGGRTLGQVEAQGEQVVCGARRPGRGGRPITTDGVRRRVAAARGRPAGRAGEQSLRSGIGVILCPQRGVGSRGAAVGSQVEEQGLGGEQAESA
jgi:hypothetical protein